MAQDAYDAIVVGSGISGGWAAKELTERGLRVLLFEAGRPIDPERDYIEHEPVYEFRFRGLGDRRRDRERQHIQSIAGPFEEQTAHFFVDDVPNPFVTDGACMTSSGCQNPSIMYMALTARRASHRRLRSARAASVRRRCRSRRRKVRPSFARGCAAIRLREFPGARRHRS